MADNIFDRSYSGSATPSDAKSKIEQIAVQSGVPVNILMAYGETSGAKNDQEMVAMAAEAADFMARDLANGRTIEQSIRFFTADDKLTEGFLTRAREIGAQLYPDQMANAPEGGPKPTAPEDGGLGIMDAARTVGAGVVDFGAGAVRAAGEGVEMAAETVNKYVNNAGTVLGADGPIVPGDAPNPLQGVAEGLNDFAEGSLRAGVSQQGQAAKEASMPSGDLFDPSTWAAGEDPTLRGYALLGADLLGSMAPVVIASLLSGGTAAAVTGGLGASGQGIKEASDQIDAMANEVLPDGRYRIEAESAAYQRLVAGGMDHEQAVARVRDDVERLAGAAGFAIGTVGGAATGAVVQGTVGRLAGGGVLRRALVSGTASAIEEGAQEVAEGMSARGAVALGADADVDITDGTLPEFVLGAMGGGVVGTVAGAASRPDAGAADPGPQPMGEDRMLPAPEPQAAPQAPKGPMRAAADQAPAPVFQGAQRGDMVTITPRGGDPIAATFDGETALAATFISEDGEVMEIPRAELESGAVAIGPARTTKPTVQEGQRPGEPLIAEADPMDPPPTVEAPEAPPIDAGRAELSPPAEAAMDYLQERWAMIREDGELSEEDAARRAAELTRAYIMRLPEQERWDDDVVELLDDLNARFGAAPVATAGGEATAPVDAPVPQADAELPGAELAEVNAPEEPPQDQEPTTAPPTAPAPAMDRETWDAMNETEREDAVRRAGYVTPKGNISGPGQKLMATPWDKLPEGARSNLGGAAVAEPQPPAAPDPVTATAAQETQAPEPAAAPATAPESEVAQGGAVEQPAALENLSPEDNAALAALEGDFKAKFGATDAEAEVATQPEAPADAPAQPEAPAADPAPVAPSAAPEARPEAPQTPERPAAPAPEAAPVVPADPPAQPAAQGGVDYPNRKLGMQKAKADPVVDGLGDSSDMSLGGVALANARPGDVLPGVGTVEKVTDKQLQIRLPNGNVARLSAMSEKLDKIARDMGALIASSANLNPEKLGSLMDMIERDPALTYQDGVPALIDDPEVRGDRPARPQRDTILRPLTDPTATEEGAGEVGEGGGEVGADLPPVPPQTEKDAEEFWDGLSMQARRFLAEDAKLPDSFTTGGYKWFQLSPAERLAIARGRLAIKTPALTQEAQEMWEAVVSAYEGMATAEPPQTEAQPEEAPATEEAAMPEVKNRGAKVIRLLQVADMEVATGGAKDALDMVRDAAEFLRAGGDADGAVRLIEAASSALFRQYPALSEVLDEIAGQLRGTDADPEQDAAAQIDAAAAEADPNPTPAQAEAGNYKKGHVEDWNGLKLTIETAKGSERRGTAPDGTEWSVTLPAHYGYIKRTEGADGEQVDFYMGGMPSSDSVVIVNQIDPETGAFDEHKVILGTSSTASALSLYEAGFSDGKGKARIGSYTQTTVANFKTWLESGDLTQPTQPIPARAGKRGPKIEDFGEKIGGARKDKARQATIDLRADRDTESMGVNDAFPEPDYEALVAAGIPQDAVALVAVLRNTIPRKPARGNWKVSGWVRDLDQRRILAADLLEGKVTVEEARPRSRFDDMTMGDFALAELLGKDIPPRLFKLAQDFNAHPDTIKFIYETIDGRRVNTGSKKVFALRSPGDPRYSTGTEFETLDAARPFLLEQLLKLEKENAEREPEGRTRKPVQLGIYDDAGKTYMIGFKVTDTVKVMGGFATKEAARAHFKENKDELQELAEKLRDGPAERRTTNLPRSGPDHRTGDVTPDQFQKAFGFKGVEFGNWNTGAERQTRLNEAYDALHDMAGALGIPTQAVSLNGTLSLAFGARGKGGRNPAAAHYEPGYVVMNLTKQAGAGSLAHEWFHALDNWLAKEDAKDSDEPARPTGKRSRRQEYATDRKRYRGSLPGPMWQALTAMREALRNEKSPWVKRSKEFDKARSEPYFFTTIELAARAFEAHVTVELGARGMRNDFLANINDQGTHPSLTEMRRFGVRQAYLEFLSQLRPMLADSGTGMVELPPVDPAALEDGPQTGMEWEGLSGTRRVVSRNGDELEVEYTNEAGETVTATLPLDTVEAMIDRDAFDLSPEGVAQREASRLMKEQREQAQREREEDKAIAEEALALFLASKEGRTTTAAEVQEMRSRSTGLRFGGVQLPYRAPWEHAVAFVRKGWTVQGAGRSRNLISPHGSYYRGVFKKNDLDFAAWYEAKLTRDAIEKLTEENKAAGLPTEFPEPDAGPINQDDDVDAPVLPPLPPEDPAPQPEAAEPEQRAAEPPAPDTPAPTRLKGLTDAENDLLADLEAQFLNKIKTQLNSGLDPELVSIAARIAGLYVKNGTRRFRALIDTMMQRLGLTLEQAQPYARSAYNQIRGDMDLAGEDVSDMDTDAEVIAEVRKMRKEAEIASQNPQKSDSLEQKPTEGTANDDGGAGQAGDGGVESGASGSGGSVDTEGAGEAGQGDGGAGDGGGAGAGSGEPRPTNLGGDGPSVARPAADTDAAAEQSGVVPRTGESAGNFRITDEFGLGAGTDGQKIKANLEAIRVVKRLDAENRYATAEEQAALARYVGWGGLKTVFDVKKADATDQWGKAQRELKELLTPSEYKAAFSSIRNAHYTSKPVVDAMWRAMRHFGFTSGRALEPTVGVGNFIGAQPEDMAGATEWYASELDSITSRIAFHLYPDATVLSTGFEKAPFTEGSFDIAIGNPPFGDETITDRNPARKHLSGMKVHNYIIAKTGTHLRPGGIMSMVVTHRFLDTANAEARSQLAKDFNFLGAIRLPNDAFRANAGTDVVTDIIFLQKRREGEAADANASWLDTEGRLEGDIRVNRYFAENPSHILGRSAMDGTMYASGRSGKGEYTVHGDGRDLSKAIDDILATSMADLAGTLGTRTEALEAAIAQEDTSKLPIGGMMLLPDGRIIRRGENQVIGEVSSNTYWLDEAEEWGELAEAAREVRDAMKAGDQPSVEAVNRLHQARAIAYTAKGEKPKTPTKAQKAVYDIIEGLYGQNGKREWEYDEQLAVIEERVESRRLGDRGFATLKALLGLRRKTLTLIRAEFSDAPNIETLRADLDQSYDAFVDQFGFINAPKNIAILQGDIGAELGLEEKYSEAVKEEVEGKKTKAVVEPERATKAKILSRRVNFPYKKNLKADTAPDALLISMSERGRVDLGLMAELLNRDVIEIRKELAEAGQIFFDPDLDRWEHVEAYLSGNIRAKMAAASAAGLRENVLALRDALPEPVGRDRVTPTIRGQWIPTEVFEEFLTELGVKQASVSVLGGAGMISATGSSASRLSDYGQQFVNPHKTVVEMFLAAANGKTLTITYRDEATGKTYKDEAATRDVQALIERMGREFQSWAYQDADRADKIIAAYNEKVNVYRNRNYDGEKYLTPVGLDTSDPNFQLRRTQKNGAWRIVQDDSALLDHVVGAGKTLTVAVGVMERRRLGLSKKPMIAVPNHLVMQWAREWLQAYPGARIMAATPADFELKNRRRMFARIATGDFDAIIIGHSSLGFIQTPVNDQKSVIEDQIAELKEVLEQARMNGESKRTLAQITKRLEKYEAKLENLSERKQDDMGFDFAEMGVDYLAVDEAHEFKNLEYSTGQERLVGMNAPNGSKRAFDLLVKARGLQRRKGAVHFATGTPVSNSLVEIYSMLKYLAYDKLKEMGMAHFDAWSSAFVEAETRFEYTATQKLKERRVMSRLVNLGALSRLYRNFADVIDRNDLERIYAEQVRAENKRNGTNKSERFPTPRVMGGGRRLLSGPPTDTQQLATDWFVARMAAIKANASDKEYPKVDNPLWVLSDARKASLDIRTLRAAANMPRDPNGKVARATRELKRIYDKWDSVKGAQMVFCDLSTPSKGAEKAAEKMIRDLAGKVFGEKDAARRLEMLRGETFMERWESLVDMARDVAGDVDTDEAQAERIEEAIDAAMDEAAGLMIVADTGFSVYDDLRASLIEQGIPEKEIAFIHDYSTPAAKAKLFQKVNAGQIRVLIGSTPKMGAGTNAQERLVALHHIDSPWRPSDVEQREGRIIRQGNALYKADPDGFEVEILAYSTTGTSDVVLWQVLERKARAIGSFRAGELDAVEEGGDDADSYAEFMAQSTGNPVFRLKMVAEKDMTEQTAVTSGALLARGRARSFVQDFAKREDSISRDLEVEKGITTDKITFANDQGEVFSGNAAEFEAVLKKAQDAAQVERDKWEAAYSKRAARADELEKQGKGKSEVRKRLEEEGLSNLGEKPPRPNAISPDVVAQSGYAQAIAAMMKRAKSMVGEGSVSAALGGGARLTLERRLFLNSPIWEAYIRHARGTIRLATAEAADPSKSPKLLEAMSPGFIAASVADTVAYDEKRLKDLREALPDNERISKAEIDTTARDEAAEAVDYYEVEVRLAEAQADIARAKRGDNVFIQTDWKRPLSEMGSEAVTQIHRFTYDGIAYTGTGLGVKQRFGDTMFFEVKRDDTGERLILVAAAPDAAGDPPKVVDVLIPPARVKREMAEARENRAKDTAKGASIPDGKIALVTRAMNGAMQRMGLEGKVTAALLRNINGLALNTTGAYRAGRIEVAEANGERGAMGVLYHEIVHALRDDALWGKPYGLFTLEEWRSLVAAARGRGDIMARVDELYGDQPASIRSEEAVAELFREWAQRRDDQGKATRALEKIKTFFRALASALRGEGFADAAMIMERIASGEVGGRGPGGGGGGNPGIRTMRAAPPESVRAAIKFDNPGGEWLKAKIARAEQNMRDTGMPRYVRNGIGGATTGYLRSPVMLPVSELAKLPAANGEARGPGEFQYEALLKDVSRMGWDDDQRGNAVLVEVNHKGQAFIVEGNTRVALAARLGVEQIKADIRWLNGGETKAGPMAPERVEAMAQVYRPAREFRMPSMPFARDEEAFEKVERGAVSSLLTDAMGGKSRKWNLLGLVPGRALFSELGKDLPAAQKYLRLKEQMDTLRSEWHHTTDQVAQKWRKALVKNRDANKAMMDLMHEATIAGVDPSRRFMAPRKRPSETEEEHDARVGKLRTSFNAMRPRWEALPEDFKALFHEVRDTYSRLGDAFEKTLIDNVRKAMSINVKRAQRAYEAEMERIRDDGLSGQERAEAEEKAGKKLASAKSKAEWGINARVTQLRLQFETNKLDGPYFPLQRHGDYFVTIRDEEGKVVSFSRFESERKQRAFVKEQQAIPGQNVEYGTMEDGDLREQVDPNFVAEVEGILGDKVGDPEVMDMIWQRWLETLPDSSVRRSRIHRKGTPGWDGDAFRAFGKQVFHGGHQLARLKYAMEMKDALEDARLQAQGSSDPNRNGLIVNEMERRNDFTMNPTGSAVAQSLTSAAFIYYLGVTPAAALVNLSQTTVVGIPVLAAGFDKMGVGKVGVELMRALGDFTAGRAEAGKSPRLTADEKAAIQEAYDRGTIDKSEAHDLAGVAESGVEYSDIRMRIMKPISFLFHHTERMNREVTFLAAYRLARGRNFGHADAVQKAADLTWKTHFDYQNTSRPRLMQSDTAKVLLVFRNYNVNVLWRLFRDLHQVMRGKSEQERREARMQLIGISAMMMFHAGITGTWGYGLLVMMAGMFAGGGSDEVEEEIKSAIINTFGTGIGGALLKGVPGHVTGIDLSGRMGMADLWFRSSERQLEGDDEYHYFMEQMLGAIPGMAQNVWRGFQQVGEGNVWRGIETASPKAVRDLMKGGRYLTEGVTTYSGDSILTDITAGDALVQALGFTPAQIAEQYESNTRLKNREKSIMGDRKEIMRAVTGAMMNGESIPPEAMEDIEAFNAANPSYPITSESIIRSLRARIRGFDETEGGIRLNPRLNAPLRAEAAPAIYN